MLRLARPTIAVALLALAPMPLAEAQIHRYIDDHGIVHLSNLSFVGDEARVEVSGGCGITAAHGCGQDDDEASQPGVDFVCGALPPFKSIIDEAARAHGLESALVAATIRVESNFNPTAVSVAGAQGLMQLMPGTAARMGVRDPFHPRQNIMGGARYLSELMALYQGDVDLALAAYNAGPPAVNAYGGVPPFEETQAFVERVNGYRECYQGVA